MPAQRDWAERAIAGHVYPSPVPQSDTHVQRPEARCTVWTARPGRKTSETPGFSEHAIGVDGCGPRLPYTAPILVFKLCSWSWSEAGPRLHLGPWGGGGARARVVPQLAPKVTRNHRGEQHSRTARNTTPKHENAGAQLETNYHEESET